MRKFASATLAAAIGLISSNIALAGTETFFIPLTESAPVTDVDSFEEETAPWVAPAGVQQWNLTSLSEVEMDAKQSIIRVPGLGSGASMMDMIAFDRTGNHLFIPHETQVGAGVSRYDLKKDTSVVLFRGDMGGLEGDWSNDYAAFDPATWTPRNTLLAAEEWAGEGRVIEILNPMANPKAIKIRELDSVPNVAHEGLRFSNDGKTLYFVDEWNSGSIYKIVYSGHNYAKSGQVFVLKVDAYAGNAADNWNEESNAGAARTGTATWVPMTDANGNALTEVDPFRNGPTNDPRSNDDTRGGRPAADELGATPYGRPEDMEVGRLANGNEVVYVTATSENAVYSIEMTGKDTAEVRVFASEFGTAKNDGFEPTTGRLNSPDNLAQDAWGNIYVIEDAPNGSATGGDIWFARDVDNNGVAESLDHFLSIRVAGSEATGMIFNPAKPNQFAVSVQHPASTDADNGFGDAIWMFDVSDVEAPESE